MKILVVRFRQLGDAILATALLNTLRANFPDAQIDFVLNDKIAPPFHNHPAIDNIITFSEKERHSFWQYITKVWRVVNKTHYDVIIDLRSTANTMLFALFSLRSRYRIGIRKSYTRLAFNHTVGECDNHCAMTDYDISYANALNEIKEIKPVNRFTLHITGEEKENYKNYLLNNGVDPKRPLMLVNVTAKLESKIWAEESMAWVVKQFINEFPAWQLIFNYAPGREEENARRIYKNLGCPQNVLIDIKARSARELTAMGYFLTCFFGNEGGARHIMQAAGCPSLVVCAPGNSKHKWLPQTDVKAEGIAPSDFADQETLTTMTRQQQYAIIKKEVVWEKLKLFVSTLKPKDF
ncbi:MAG: glycosyltransferase family 9 protein [Bacteroidaceae bacterium]